MKVGNEKIHLEFKCCNFILPRRGSVLAVYFVGFLLEDDALPLICPSDLHDSLCKEMKHSLGLGLPVMMKCSYIIEWADDRRHDSSATCVGIQRTSPTDGVDGCLNCNNCNNLLSTS